ncbi:MAG: hypothetical protein GY722_27880 [bacterium]|nr:hypothetical protein [bacterium]
MRTPGSRRCHYHGGAKAQIPRGDRRRGGPDGHCGIYRRWLTDEEKDCYDETLLGNLDDEIRVVKAKLAWIIKVHSANPEGGIKVEARKGTGVSVKMIPYIEIAEQLTDQIRRLELARAKLRDHELADDSATEQGTSVTDSEVKAISAVSKAINLHGESHPIIQECLQVLLSIARLDQGYRGSNGRDRLRAVFRLLDTLSGRPGEAQPPSRDGEAKGAILALVESMRATSEDNETS